MASRKETIEIIGPTPPPYHGVSVATQFLLDALPSGQFSVVHLDTADRRGIGHVDQPDLWDVLLFIRQWLLHVKILVSKRPRVCYLPICQSRIGFFRDSLFMIPAFVTRTSVIAHLHGANFGEVYSGAGRFFKWYMDSILKRVDKFVVLGEMLKPIFQNWVHPEYVAVVPNGVPETFTNRPDNASSAVSRKLRVVFLSTLSRQKGLFVLLDAVPLVKREYSDVEFHIAGPWVSASTEETARKQLAAMHQESSVTFHGQLAGDEKMQFLRDGDIFVFPGIQQEGQPLTVLEAMCSGLPVIATDRGCLRETVVEGETGFIIQPHSPTAIADRILQLIQEPDTRKQMAAHARRRYEQEYTMSTFVARMADLFAQVSQSDYHEKLKSMDSRHLSTR